MSRHGAGRPAIARRSGCSSTSTPWGWTSLLGGMWSATMLPLRVPQWWQPSLSSRAAVQAAGW